MRFRPCIDLHQGKVKQIIGETLSQENQELKENFVSDKDSIFYSNLFKKDKLKGGHIIMLGEGNESEAVKALREYKNGMQIGGGINNKNASFYLLNGASHIIITSFVFQNGKFNLNNLKKILKVIDKEKLVIDLSCKKKNNRWYVVTNKWKVFSDFEINKNNLDFLNKYCSEFLIHAVDVEGKMEGFEKELVRRLEKWISIPTTYAGGVRSLNDIELFKKISKGKLDITIGSALDIFGGDLSYKEVVRYFKK